MLSHSHSIPHSHPSPLTSIWIIHTGEGQGQDRGLEREALPSLYVSIWHGIVSLLLQTVVKGGRAEQTVVALGVGDGNQDLLMMMIWCRKRKT